VNDAAINADAQLSLSKLTGDLVVLSTFIPCEQALDRAVGSDADESESFAAH
jgi:hypothetical protein